MLGAHHLAEEIWPVGNEPTTLVEDGTLCKTGIGAQKVSGGSKGVLKE